MTKGYDSKLFLDSKYYRTTTTGVNCYTKKLKNDNEYKINEVFNFVEKLKDTLVINKSISKCKNLNTYGNYVVDDCIDELKNCGRGYVFNFEQLKEVIRLYGFNFNLEYDTGVYFLYPQQD